MAYLKQEQVHRKKKEPSRLRSTKPLKAKKPLRTKSPLRAKSRPLTKEERGVYERVNERIRVSDSTSRCERCNRVVSNQKIHRHHVIPRSRGGKTVDENVIGICYICHGKEHGLHIIEH